MPPVPPHEPSAPGRAWPNRVVGPDPAFCGLAAVALAATAWLAPRHFAGEVAWLLPAWSVYRPLRIAGRGVHGWLLAALALWAGLSPVGAGTGSAAIATVAAVGGLVWMVVAGGGLASAAALVVAGGLACLSIAGLVPGTAGPAWPCVLALVTGAASLGLGVARGERRRAALGGLGLLLAAPGALALARGLPAPAPLPALAALAGLLALIAGDDLVPPATLRRMPR
ncbi:hypothetical protein FHR90_002243 [Endobacter medicaginis]|uniref:Uncharacterized protein n=1 Tax=Endobacter medicaginis TaxID=1181271 RepID=A0A839V4C8_9PROT|nr:hypothetical protein [Endobacter medicaginis]MBB3174402.1 hypothetical protein [Endobacter medicaginis]MCX5475313.1 hypothetical protein [Endobacter medicaginis]